MGIIRRFFAGWYRFVTTRKSNLGTAAAVLGSLLVVCCVLSFIIGLVSPVKPRQQIGQVPTTNNGAQIVVATDALPTIAPEPTQGPTMAPVPPTLAPTEVPTDTPIPTEVPTDTPVPTNTPPPARQTAQAKADATATIVALDAEYPEADIRDLVKGPDRYRDRKFHLQGTVFTIREETGLLSGVTTIMQIWVQVPGGSEFEREAVVVRFKGTLEGVFKDSPVIVYGTGAGAFEGTNTFGAKIVQPGMDATFVRY